MPKEVFGDDFVFLPKNELLTFDEMARIAKVYAEIISKYLFRHAIITPKVTPICHR
jgi:cyclic pyranopterin phosphate synthase